MDKCLSRKERKVMSDIIIDEGDNKYSFSNIEEAVQRFLGKDFYMLKESEKYKKNQIKNFNECNF